ncbi:MAG: hypothetical protein JW757_06125 [Anaerolineales bacterium]|nr:hypothetical protein [Anaerolineales bacterium]
MNKKWKLVLFTTMIILAFLACNLPGGSSLPATDSPTQLPATDSPPEQPAIQEPSEPEQPAEEPAPEETLDPEAGCTPDSEFIDDVTLPDGTLVSPGQTITKTWRIKNDGTCTWTGDYVWEQLNFGESKLKANVQALPLPVTVAPGQTYDISVELVLAADAEIGSRHTARFQMRSPEGDLFGTHPFATIFASPGSGTCPIGTADQKTFINPEERFCFLYPKDYDAYIGGMGHTYVRHPLTPGVIEEIVATVSIANYGSAGGLSTTDWADQMIDEWKAPATTPAVKNIDIGGMTGRYTDDLPGMTGNRIVFLVHNGDGFVFTIIPVDDAFGDRKQRALDLWNLVRSEFTFFGP